MRVRKREADMKGGEGHHYLDEQAAATLVHVSIPYMHLNRVSL